MPKKRLTVTKESLIGDMVHKYPATADVMLSYGLACVGCSINVFESVEEGARVHGQMTDSEIDEMLIALNKVAKPAKTFKIGKSFMVTERAYRQILHVRKEEGKDGYGLELEVTQEDGDKHYDLEFKKSHKKNQTIYKLKEVDLFIDPLSYDLIKDMTMDFITNAFQSGFKFE